MSVLHAWRIAVRRSSFVVRRNGIDGNEKDGQISDPPHTEMHSFRSRNAPSHPLRKFNSFIYLFIIFIIFLGGAGVYMFIIRKIISSCLSV